jgi:hypothetical protein
MRLGVSFRRAICPGILLRAIQIRRLLSVLGLIVVGHIVGMLLLILPFIIRHLVVTLSIVAMRSRSSDSNSSRRSFRCSSTATSIRVRDFASGQAWNSISLDDILGW